MYRIKDGYVVDNMGFHVSAFELRTLIGAATNSLALGNERRMEMAIAHCKENYPSMVTQMDWRATSGDGVKP